MTSLEPTVFLIDDDPALCDAITWLLQSVGLNVVVHNNGQDYLATYDPLKPGCILLDIRMPVMGGFELFDELNKRNNRLPVIFITGHGDVPMAVRAMQEGAVDFILKPFNDQLLLEKVQKAIAIDKEKRSKSIDSDSAKRLQQLTIREQEVLEKIVAGKLSKQIAFDLKISESTVDFHRGNLMRKMKVKTIAELVKLHVLYAST
jgi:FixJ family two-component response regulator